MVGSQVTSIVFNQLMGATKRVRAHTHTHASATLASSRALPGAALLRASGFSTSSVLGLALLQSTIWAPCGWKA